MDVIKAIELRKSTRKFQEKELPDEVIKKIVMASLRSPSATNVQPWKLHIVKGEILEKIKNDNEEKYNSGIEVDVPEPELNPVFRQRRKELAIDLFQLLEIKREDKGKREAWGLAGNRLYEAPCVVFVTIEKNFFENKWGVLNAGLIIQSICLAAMEYNVATCITEQGSSYHEVMKRHLKLDDDEVMLIAVLMGYEETEAAENALVSKRASMEELVRYY